MRTLESPLPETLGPFRIVRRLGVGGMAETFEGVRAGPGGFVQRVCIKRVLPALHGDDELRALFLREARLLARLSHRNVTCVVELGADAGYLAIELVDGVDLRRLRREQPGGRVPFPVVTLIGLEVAEALAHAHEQGIVHRDVSPANVLVSADGDVKLTDFGIAKPLAAGLAASGVIRGNPWYMAPERMEPGREDSPRADLFSLGAVLFECLSGRPPCGIARLPEDTPGPLREVIERLLSLDPSERLESARSTVELLAPLVSEARARAALRTLVRPVARPPRAAPELPARWRRYAVAPQVWEMRARADDTTRADEPVAHGRPALGARLAALALGIALLVALVVAATTTP